MDFCHTLEEDDTWDRFYRPDADIDDPPTMDEIRILREFVDRYWTALGLDFHYPTFTPSISHF